MASVNQTVVATAGAELAVAFEWLDVRVDWLMRVRRTAVAAAAVSGA